VWEKEEWKMGRKGFEDWRGLGERREWVKGGWLNEYRPRPQTLSYA
jgi:hypothetical protein